MKIDSVKSTVSFKDINNPVFKRRKEKENDNRISNSIGYSSDDASNITSRQGHVEWA